MDKPPYKLSSVLLGHSADVRAVATFLDGTVVSVSRDKTARVWKPTGKNNEYEQIATLTGHSNFVNSVCVINPSERDPKGYIITGSNDNTICVYVANETVPAHTLTAHQNNVCNLKTGKKEGTFLSSSWDLTAKLWDVKDLSKPQVNLVGHTAAVWCVADLSSGSIISGSADKLIIVWSRDGSVQHKLAGHTDCVRDIIDIKEDEFLSCANDATIRHWNAKLGTCLGTYCGHENYIYSIVAIPNGTYVYSSGEDRTIRIWYNAELKQTIVLPTQSIWCIDLFSNGDIVAGSSDGAIRIFSSDPERYANRETLETFEKEVANTTLNAQQIIGDINIKDLPDSRVLLQPGQRDGQTKIVNEGDGVRAYSWSQSEQRWIKIGDVMGASGGTAATSGKQLYNGIEYDYVFSVDIQDGVPPLKLPYNKGQDPWHVAQKFLHDNNLSQLFLDQVANFIVKNSEPSPILNTGSQYVDPFTGGSRYVPGSGTSSNASSCAPDVSAQSSAFNSSNTSASPSYIPHSKYLKLEQANLSAILEKLYELNNKQENIFKISEEKLNAIEKFMNNQVSEEITASTISALKSSLDWPNHAVFPALDIARLAVLHKEVNDQLCTEELLSIIRRHIKSDAALSNQMLTFRLIANMFQHEKGEKLCLDHKDEILTSLLDLQSLGNKNNQVAISTYILNLIVALNKYNDAPGRTRALNVLFTILPRLNEPEAMFRALVGLGTLLAATPDPSNRNELISAVRQSETALNVLRTLSESTTDLNMSNKVVNCSKQIIDLII
ncbi:PREDICTED: phospholipase A-2-activating protein [Acromyrmex echinatior]|uniref:Phospholipase A-2-activating protein n=1 Tax=Acromyrmex echinatior TaxID=103372 RepID=F4WRD3_ACREC|nr:PREDICTED: phospholipase A-2-activating protein [Acromyrmex echinatior]EGI63204.1 Phospholipase A-2-activating protein [Acromyrmex echinatior]